MADYNTAPASTALPALADAQRVTAFLRKVYAWMCAGLGVTAFVAFTVVGSPTIIRAIWSNQVLFFGLFAAELGLVFFLSASAPKLERRDRGPARLRRARPRCRAHPADRSDVDAAPVDARRRVIAGHRGCTLGDRPPTDGGARMRFCCSVSPVYSLAS